MKEWVEGKRGTGGEGGGGGGIGGKEVGEGGGGKGVGVEGGAGEGERGVARGGDVGDVRGTSLGVDGNRRRVVAWVGKQTNDMPSLGKIVWAHGHEPRAQTYHERPMK